MPPEPQPGEQAFLERYERQFSMSGERPRLDSIEARSRIEKTLKSLLTEIESLPEIKKEIEEHPKPISNLTNVLAQAIQQALSQGVVPGLQMLQATGNAYLIDAYHDVLINHYLSLLQQHGKLQLA